MRITKNSPSAPGNKRGTGPMTTPGSPETPPVSAEEDRDDFGYAVGAAEIHALFAVRFSDARRRLARHEVPFAITALRDEKGSALEALERRCRGDRREAHAAERDRDRLARRPALDRPRPRLACITN